MLFLLLAATEAIDKIRSTQSYTCISISYPIEDFDLARLISLSTLSWLNI